MHKVDTAGSVNGLWVDKNPPSVPGTLMGKNWHNAVQQELVQLIEGVGISIEGSGSTDASAGFQQLRQALLEKFIGVDIRRFGAVGDGVTDDRDAIVQALTVSPVIHIPEGDFLISSPINLPEGACVIGRGLNSKFKVSTDHSVFTVTNVSVLISDLVVNGSGIGTMSGNQHFLSVNMSISGNKQIRLLNILSNALDGAMVDVNATSAGNNLFVTNSISQYSKFGFRFGTNSGDVGCDSIISNTSISNCSFPIWSGYTTERVLLEGCQLFGGEFRFDHCKQIFLMHNTCDVAAYNFDNCDGVIFQNCQFPNTLSNAITNDTAALASYFEFRQGWTENGGSWVPGIVGGINWYETLQGGYQQVLIGADKIISSSSYARVRDSEMTLTKAQRVGINNNQTKFTFFDGSLGNVYKRIGSGPVKLTWNFLVKRNNTTVDPKEIYAILSGSGAWKIGGSMRLPFGGTEISTGLEWINFSGSVELMMNVGDYFYFDIGNLNSSDSITVASGSYFTASGL